MGIPPGNTNPEKPAIIVNFIEGVWAAGDKGEIVCDYNPIECRRCCCTRLCTSR